MYALLGHEGAKRDQRLGGNAQTENVGHERPLLPGPFLGGNAHRP